MNGMGKAGGVFDGINKIKMILKAGDVLFSQSYSSY
jgi:hypothetical protein